MRADAERPTAGAPSDWPERPRSHDARSAFPGSVPGYRLVALIHRGGQGAVYRAVQLSTGREVAVKVLATGAHASDAERRRFERECDVIAVLDHPNVVALLDRGEADGQPFLAMRLVEGEDLDAWVARRRPSLAERLRVFLAACDGVAHAHQRGVIHRDLKPRNIRVDADGQPHVLDFGLGKPLADLVGPDPSSLTMDGHFIGTLAFAAPEQLSGDHSKTDARTDVHALGLILYWLLTERMPYPVGGDVAEVLRAVQLGDPQPPRAHVPDLDLDLQTIVLKALAREPSRRYPTVDALATDLRRHLAGRPIDARSDSRWYVFAKTVRRHRALVASAAAVVAVLVAGIAGVASQRNEARRQELRARTEAESADKIARVLSGMLELTFDVPGRPADVPVARLLDRARDTVLPGLDDEPIVQSRVALALANAYRTLGRHEDAMALMGHLTRLSERADARPEDRLEAARLAATLLRSSRGNDASEPAHRRAVELARELDAALPPTLLPSCLAGHGQVLIDMARPADGVPLIEEALALARERASDDRLFLAEMTERLGNVRRSQGREAEALRLRQEARDLYVAHAGGPSALAAHSLSLDAVTCWETARPREAEEFARRSLAMFEQLGMSEHPQAGQAQNHLGLALRELRRYDEARAAFDEALRIFRKGAGEGHFVVGVVLRNVAELEEQRGDAVAALRARDAVAAWEKRHGPDAGAP